MSTEAEQTQPALKRFKRQVARALAHAEANKHDRALANFERALETAGEMGGEVTAEPELLLDLARVHQGIGNEARHLGKVDVAIDAFRSCHQVVNQLATMAPDNPRRQHNLTLVNASLRDTLREADDKRLALAAARLAVVSADNVAERFGQELSWIREALQQRIVLGKMLKSDPKRRVEGVNCLKRACRTARALYRRDPSEAAHFDLLRRAHLDLADLQQALRDYDDCLETLGILRGICTARLRAEPSSQTRLQDMSLVAFLAGLVHAMDKTHSLAIVAFRDGLSFLDKLGDQQFLSNPVQAQRAKLICHAVQSINELRDSVEHDALRIQATRRLRDMADEAEGDTKKLHAVMSASHDLARLLIDRQEPVLACEALQLARDILDEIALSEQDSIYLRRWTAFLDLELGRALRERGDIVGARTAFSRSLEVNEALLSDNPADVRAQCDSAYTSWQFACLMPSERKTRLRRAHATLRFLARSSRLPDYAQRWLSGIERDLRMA